MAAAKVYAGRAADRGGNPGPPMAPWCLPASLEAPSLGRGSKMLDGSVASQRGKASKCCLCAVPSYPLLGGQECLSKGLFGPPLTSSSRVWQTLPVQGQTVNILGFVGHAVPVATTPVCHCSVKTATDDISGLGSIQPYL